MDDLMVGKVAGATMLKQVKPPLQAILSGK
jgi:hypothetical protein